MRPPMKIADVRPVYPSSALKAGVQGTVSLLGRIGVEGDVEEVTVLSAPHADLARSAEAAVRQWQFTATLLNCVPVAVNMTVNVQYELER